jgi:hypothetical protein
MPMPRHGFAWHTDGAKAASVPSPFELVSRSVPVPCRGARLNEMLEVAGLIPHDQPVGPLGANLAAFWQQIASIVPFLPTLPTAKHRSVCYLQIAAHLDTEACIVVLMPVPAVSCDAYVDEAAHRTSVDTRG